MTRQASRSSARGKAEASRSSSAFPATSGGETAIPQSATNSRR
ncbi:hypothetical protein [Amycolatopsis coloradensis]|nr:hypothetical protein [Amycolatopsis coloradensis]